MEDLEEMTSVFTDLRILWNYQENYGFFSFILLPVDSLHDDGRIKSSINPA